MKTIQVILFAAGILSIQGSCNPDTPPAKTDANFSVAGYEMPVPANIAFLNTSTNATSYFWDFGDGTTSTSSNPTHTYNFDGTYLLKLRVTGASGTDSACKLLTLTSITANQSAMSYFFDRCSGTPVGAAFKTVNPASTNTVWDFGNGVINVGRDPIVQFLFPGDYTVKYSSLINGVRDTVVRIIQIL